MKFARISVEGRPYVARLEGDVLVPIVAESAGSDIGSWMELSSNEIANLSPVAEEVAVRRARFLPVVARPSKILAIGLNYYDHATESDLKAPDAPLMFAKMPNTLLGAGETIRCPADLTTQADYEAELAVVIGRTASRIREADALDHVFGYAVANDVSARDAQFSDGQWVRGKSFDTFCPIGPYLTPVSDVPDLGSLRISSRLNGVTMQDESLSSMMFPVPELVSYLSRCITLEPGDVILTGTPAGVGFAQDPPIYLSDGDIIEIEIEGLGVLRNDVSTAKVLPAMLPA